MDQRTGGQTAVGMINISFGLMGIVVSLLLFALGRNLEADLAAHSAASAPGMFITRLPTTDLVSSTIEFMMIATWMALIAAGAGVLRLAPWGRSVSMLCGAMLFLVGCAKSIDSGLSFITVGEVAYGVLLCAVFLRADWRLAFSGVTAELRAAEAAAQATDVPARQAA